MISSSRLFLGLLALLVLAPGCAKKNESTAPAAATNKTGKIKLGFLVKQPEEPWFQFEWKGAGKAAAQYDFELVKLGVPDGEKTIAAIDNLAALAPKASSSALRTSDSGPPS